MADIINFTQATGARQKPACKGHWLIDSPLDRKTLLGQIDDYGSHVVVRPVPGCGAQKRYVLDTPIEAARLLLRLHGFHRAIVTPAAKGLTIHLPSQAAGEE
jgi:hypothetical protein